MGKAVTFRDQGSENLRRECITIEGNLKFTSKE
jgi:hypothetical protein